MTGCCGQFITELVVRKIKENQFFSILADEASDCSSQDKLSLVIRYGDSDCVIREEFLGFLHCDLGLSGKALAETVLGGLISLYVQKQLQQFLDILMGYLHIFVKLTVKHYQTLPESPPYFSYWCII